jgi:hypothetical protein
MRNSYVSWVVFENSGDGFGTAGKARFRHRHRVHDTFSGGLKTIKKLKRKLRVTAQWRL